MVGLKNFTVGATNMNPLVVAPNALSSSDYSVCATEEDTIPASELRSYTCAQGVSGRYVFVLKANSSSNLHLCEMQVFASEQKRKYNRMKHLCCILFVLPHIHT